MPFHTLLNSCSVCFLKTGTCSYVTTGEMRSLTSCPHEVLIILHKAEGAPGPCAAVSVVSLYAFNLERFLCLCVPWASYVVECPSFGLRVLCHRDYVQILPFQQEFTEVTLNSQLSCQEAPNLDESHWK